MNKLTVLFDSRCNLCVRCAGWLHWQEQLLPLELLASSHPSVAERFPDLALEELEETLTVVADSGEVYRGPKAFIMCLFALKQFRAWSERLARPELLPFAKIAFILFSKGRGPMSTLLRYSSDQALQQFYGSEAKRDSFQCSTECQ